MTAGEDAHIQEWQIFLGIGWSKSHSEQHQRRPPVSSDTEPLARPRGRRIPAVRRGQKARPRAQCPPPGPQGRLRAAGMTDLRLPAWTQPASRALIPPLSLQKTVGHPASAKPAPLAASTPPPRVATHSIPRARRQRKAAPEPTLSPQGPLYLDHDAAVFPWLRQQRHQTSRQTQPPPRCSLFRNPGP